MEAVIGFGYGLNAGCKRRVKNISHTSNQNCLLGDGTNRQRQSTEEALAC